ncbi:conserved protein of unknown function [Nitrospira japonica]|uniref:Uncharacterized protein n=1 Tax=Nitrospira japonica TaxID=1325564 RepID=A0A1W1I7U0_9BACT|nr:hypothetical protein [Nitrospira japonica]SLM49118.1 conserved protein of unknown function [Nitrospira japonica]
MCRHSLIDRFRCEATRLVIATVLVVLGGFGTPAPAIDVAPTNEQIRAALDRGKDAAQQHEPPDSFYVRFGSTDALHPSGFLITKLGSLSVMATHMALRGLEPSDADILQVLETKTMLVSTVIFGNVPTFAADSYMVFDQGGHTIKPATVRFDGQGSRSAAWPESPRFKAKVIASFNYADFDPKAPTTLTVFPANGGEVSFALDFSQFP